MKRLLLIVLVPLLLWRCENFLDIVPEEDMTTLNSIFETRDGAYDWLKSCYAFLQGRIPNALTNEAFLGADEFVVGDHVRNSLTLDGLQIGSGMQHSLDPYGDYWSKTSESGGRSDFYTAINMCNHFIAHIDDVYNMDDQEKREWKAEVQALKAYYYFELVRRYGPIILVPENIDPNVDIQDMQIPRSHVDTCFAHIVRLCDEAAKVLLPFNMKESTHAAYFCREAALALKARALLYQASDLFNGNPDYATFKNKNGDPLFSSVKDKEKWRIAAEAAEEAIEVCRENGKRLITNQVSTTELLTDMKNIEYSTWTFNFGSEEALFMVKKDGTRSGYADFYPWTLPNLTTDPNHYLSGACMSPSLKMVEMFYTINGLPIDQDPTWGGGNPYGITRETDVYYTDVVALNEDVLVLHTKREPRFYATIAADRCYWQLGTTTANKYKVEAYQGENFGLTGTRIDATTPQNLSGYWLKKWTYSVIPLYNYANNFSSIGDCPFPLIRVAELYLAAAEAWNEYLDAPNADVWNNLDVIRTRAGIPDVRTSWAMARDRNKVNTKEGMREIIRQEWNIEYAFEGVRYWNLRRWKTAAVELNENLYGWNVLGDTKEKFYNNFQGPIIVSSENKFVAPRDYLYPIRSEETTIAGCVQNPGW